MAQQISGKQIVDFKRAIVAVYKEHGLSIGHEDHHGAFLIREIADSDIKWIEAARYEKW